MYIHDQFMKARHDDLLQAAAHYGLAAQARRARIPHRHHPGAASARRRAAVRLRQLFS